MKTDLKVKLFLIRPNLFDGLVIFVEKGYYLFGELLQKSRYKTGERHLFELKFLLLLLRILTGNSSLIG